MPRRLFLLTMLLTASSCATRAVAERDRVGIEPEANQAPAPRDDVGARLASRAGQLVGLESLRAVTTDVPDDCSGLVRYLYRLEGVDLLEPNRGRTSNASAAIWGTAQQTAAVAV